MLSKEEIECIEKEFERSLEILSRRMVGTATEITIIEQPMILLFKDLIWRLKKQQGQIKQLETEKQNLIEKLEKRRNKNNRLYGKSIDNDEFIDMYEHSGRVQEDDYILSYMKGEEK